MISSRWPRPTFVIVSIALMPVESGSFTGCRCTTPGALNSSVRYSCASIVERIAERVDDAAQQRLTDGHAGDAAGAAHRLALVDELPLAEERRADVVLLEVEREPDDAVLELEHLHRDRVLEPVDAGDAVADLQDAADLGEVGLDVVVLDPLAEDRGDLFGAQLQGFSLGPHEFMSESLEPAAHARIDAVRAGLEHDAPHEVRVDAARRLDLAPGRLLDLGDDRLRLLVRQLARRRELDR